MRLRGTLLLVLIAALALPWAGWQLVRQLEAVLREGQERAQIDAARALARALLATEPERAIGGPTLFVHALRGAIHVDGSGDDWDALEPTRSVDGRLAITLGEDADGRYALIEVRDATRVRADAADPLGRRGDRVELSLNDARGLQRWTLANAAPGALQTDAGGSAVLGEWQETADGYRIELRLPLADGTATLGVVAHDERGAAEPPQRLSLGAGAGVDVDDTRPLVRASTAADRALAQLVPPNARLRLLGADGWVLGRAGDLDLAEPAAAPPSRHSWLYRLLLAPPSDAAVEFAMERARLDAPVVWQALSGVAASNVRAASAQDSVVVAAAVPLERDGRPAGALLLEQGSDALLLVANRAVFGIATATLIVMLAAALVLFGYAGLLSLRIRRLRDAAERALRPDGRLDPHLPHLAARDDLGDLSRSFAKLLAEVGIYNDYLRTLGSKLSHELNTPLAIVRSSLDNLEHEQLGAGARTYAERARDGAERLAGILRSMASASRVERAIAAAEGEDFDLAELVRGTAAAYRDLLAPRRVEVQVPDAALTLHGAPDLIAQALDKLIDNARSFAPADGWVRIRARPLDGGVELAVANSGPPLPERMQERLFDSLVSVREAAERVPGETPHLGLGLFIVRLVAELHRGSAAARNLPDAGGVEFTLLLRHLPRRRL